jgi:acyl-CoA thioester hydrolase
MPANADGLILTYRGVVYPWQCDHLGHMNVMWYTGKFDEATWNLFASVGITASYIRERKRGMAAVQQNTTYKKELLAGDVVSIHTRVLEVRERLVRFEHRLTQDEEQKIAATTELTAVHLDLESRKAVAFFPEIAERWRTFMRAGEV